MNFRVRFNVPLDTFLGGYFYRSNDPTNSVKALKEEVNHTDRPQSHQAHLTMSQ